MRWRWRNGGDVGAETAGAPNSADSSPRLPARLERWNALWESLSGAWADGNATGAAATATTRDVVASK